ncbi:MAG: TRAP transporter small permease subunit [Saprospiraceae bacterium]|nr:TRAP transporter small permease subunit [Saprospiraceae bacterium]
MLKKLNLVNEWVGKSISWVSTLLVLLIFIEVIVRKLFSLDKIWVSELSWHLFAAMFLFSAGYTLRADQHVRVDVFYQNLTARKQAWINLIGSVLLLIPWCLIIIYTSFQYAMNSWLIGEKSPDPGGLPARYLIKFTITAGFLLLLYQAVILILQSLRTIRGKEN